jgi:hypothetical protein
MEHFAPSCVALSEPAQEKEKEKGPLSCSGWHAGTQQSRNKL